jgi:hypothetical protein
MYQEYTFVISIFRIIGYKVKFHDIKYSYYLNVFKIKDISPDT